MIIEKNIPMPADGRTRAKYPFNEMAIGDSFLIAASRPEIARTRNLVGSSIRHHAKDGKTFKARSVEGGLRVWRTA